jgi:hypothetical protein
VPAALLRVTNTAGTVSVELRVTRPGGRQSVRSLRAPSCADALEASALIIAITFDPDASVESTGADPESHAASGESEDGPGATPAAPQNPNPPSRSAFSSAGSARAELPSTHAWAVGVFGSQLQGVAPRTMTALGVFGAVSWRHGHYSPGLQARVGQSFSVSLVETDGRATFSAQYASVDACPAGLVFGPASLRACAHLGVVLLHARGTDTFSPRSVTRPEVALGGELSGALALTPVFGIVASGACAANLRRDRFAFSPTEFYGMPALSWQGSLGLELRFP